MNDRQKWPLAELFLSLVTIMLVVGIALRIPLAIPFLASAFFGAVVLHLWRSPRIGEALAVVLFAIALAAMRWRIFGGKQLGVNWLASAGIFLGLASLLVLSLTFCWSGLEERKARFSLLLTSMAIPFFVIASTLPIVLSGALHPRTYDPILYSIDLGLGFDPSFLLGRALDLHPWVKELCVIAYFQLPLGVALLYGNHVTGPNRERRQNVYTIFAVAGAAGYALYNILPAAGPRYLFPRLFPDGTPALSLHLSASVPMASTIPRNAMPSLHMAWALLIFWNARQSPLWMKVVSWYFLAFTILATMGSGEHYAVDLAVAVPFALAVQAGCEKSRSKARTFAAVTGAVLTITWILLLRFAPAMLESVPKLTWALLLSSAALSLVFEWVTSQPSAYALASGIEPSL